MRHGGTGVTMNAYSITAEVTDDVGSLLSIPLHSVVAVYQLRVALFASEYSINMLLVCY